jgi:CheY-like chemotaxis protein
MPDKTILVVDDSSTVRKLLKGELTKRGYLVLSAEDGEEGLATAIDTAPNLIISDINMPGMDGWEFCWHVRKHEDLRSIPFVFLSDRDEISDRVRGLEIGAEDYITKPFQVDDLIGRMEVVMSRTVKPAEGPNLESSLAGQLNTFNLPDLLQNINMLGKSGVLEIKRDEVAKVYIQKGEVINADAGAVSGKKAFFRILTWKEGTFTFRECVPNAPSVFQENTIKLILNALKQEDEISKLRRGLPRDEDPLLINFNDSFFSYNFDQKTRDFLELVQKHRALRQIVDASPLEDLKVYKALSLLLSADVLRIAEPGESEAATPDGEDGGE